MKFHPDGPVTIWEGLPGRYVPQSFYVASESDMMEYGIPTTGFTDHYDNLCLTGWYARMEDTQGFDNSEWVGPFDRVWQSIRALARETGIYTFRDDTPWESQKHKSST